MVPILIGLGSLFVYKYPEKDQENLIYSIFLMK